MDDLVWRSLCTETFVPWLWSLRQSLLTRHCLCCFIITCKIHKAAGKKHYSTFKLRGKEEWITFCKLLEGDNDRWWHHDDESRRGGGGWLVQEVFRLKKLQSYMDNTTSQEYLVVRYITRLLLLMRSSGGSVSLLWLVQVERLVTTLFSPEQVFLYI